jgi:predicted AlkP superfamily pyrophosphatase or phosphodiesterase
MKKTIFIWIDALREDYLQKMPFLNSLCKKYDSGILIPPMGYRTLIDFYTGENATVHNQFAAYGYSGKDLKKYNLLKKIVPNKYFYIFLNLIRYYKKQSLIQGINLNYINFFEPSNNKNYYLTDSLSVQTIFDDYRKKNKKFLIYDWPQIITNKKNYLDFNFRDDKKKIQKFLRLLKKDEDIYFVHLLDLDKIGHEFGPESNEMNKSLINEDNYVREILSKFDIKEDNFLIFSDHGMINVKETCDLKSILPEFNKGYIYFLDSTMARFWFFNEQIKKQVLDLLKNSKEGHLLTKEEKSKYNLNFKNNFYGDEIFLMNPGILILPNFFQDKPVKGAHGYDISDKNEKTVFITNIKSKDKLQIKDLFNLTKEFSSS